MRQNDNISDVLLSDYLRYVEHNEDNKLFSSTLWGGGDF